MLACALRLLTQDNLREVVGWLPENQHAKLMGGKSALTPAHVLRATYEFVLQDVVVADPAAVSVTGWSGTSRCGLARSLGWKGAAISAAHTYLTKRLEAWGKWDGKALLESTFIMKALWVLGVMLKRDVIVLEDDMVGENYSQWQVRGNVVNCIAFSFYVASAPQVLKHRVSDGDRGADEVCVPPVMEAR